MCDSLLGTVLLHQWWVLPDRGGEGEEMAVDQLDQVLPRQCPRQCREMVLKLAHTKPLAGHLGRDKTEVYFNTHIGFSSNLMASGTA